MDALCISQDFTVRFLWVFCLLLLQSLFFHFFIFSYLFYTLHSWLVILCCLFLIKHDLKSSLEASSWWCWMGHLLRNSQYSEFLGFSSLLLIRFPKWKFSASWLQGNGLTSRVREPSKGRERSGFLCILHSICIHSGTSYFHYDTHTVRCVWYCSLETLWYTTSKEWTFRLLSSTLAETIWMGVGATNLGIKCFFSSFQ